jgi:tetratricopeptide (TPR) repeat protein
MLELTNGLDSRERYATRRATALITAGRLSEAESVLREALQAERDALLSKPRSGRYRVCTRACVLSELLSRSDDEAVLSEAEQLAREAGQGTDDSSSERYAIILARVLAKQGKHDEARIVLRQRLSQCKKYNMHELEANLALVLFRHAQALRQELDEEEQEAEYDDTVAQTALRLKWSARSHR